MHAHTFRITYNCRVQGGAESTVALVPDEVSAALLTGPHSTRVLASYWGSEVDLTRLLPTGGEGAYYLLSSVEKHKLIHETA